ncbi:MAG TPA: zinc-dependent metalloprotease [Terriglobia bacterium]|nr:zinc-dependent metalloprotease [Terriglobia bacterium]
MMQRRRFAMWAFAAAGIAAFVLGASAQGVVRAISQGVVTPENPIWAQDPSGPQTPAPAPDGDTPADNAAGGRGNQPGGRGAGAAQPRPYNQVITASAKTDEGIFKVHRINEQLFYEIPKKELGKDFLWVSQLKNTVNGAGYGGTAAGNRVVRWELLNNRVFLRLVDYSVIADPSTPIARAVAAANNPSIMRAYNVAAFSPTGDPVIEVTQLFTTEVPEFSVRSQVTGSRGFDGARSYIEKVVSFPENINVEVVQTFTAPLDAGNAADPAAGRGRGRGNSFTVLTSYSMVKLPETPMMGRLYDERVGYFTRSMYDYSREEHRAEQRTYITRYRLEKKDPASAMSEPVKPIVYYVDPATPTKWVPYVKKGIEDWQSAFEAAGFRNAIVAREAPSDDPDWSAEDARYSVVRWLPSTTENASGPNIHDPRSGEILEADIQFYHNVQNLQKNWYFVQVGPLDPRAKKLPLPDDLMGELLRYVVAHEVGHTLGLQHNMKASSIYTLEQIRDKNFLRQYGHTPSLMDYSRFNYVAQPEDGIPVADLIPKIGEYDKFAIRWGYTPITAKTSDDEQAELNKWASEQDSKPQYRFSTAGSGSTDPGDLSEAVGDGDAVRATTLGLKNLQRVADMLLTATTGKPGEPYDELTEVYGRLVGQWTTEMNHVTSIVGGFLSQQKHIGQTGPRFTSVPKAKQAEAVKFLLDNAFQTPQFMVRPDILRLIQPTGAIARVRTAQNSVMNSLLQAARLDRLIEQAAVDGAAAYAPTQFLGEVRAGIWNELRTPSAAIDAYRRNTQRIYLDTIDNRLNGPTEPSPEVRALFKGELRTLRGQLVAAIPSATDRATRLHLEDSRDAIDEILDPRAMRARTAPAAAAGRGFANSVRLLDSSSRFDYENDPFVQQPTTCWPDYVIR